MPSDQSLSLAAQEVRRHDRERFVTALFAPAGAREDLMVLYAFNLELARIRESVHEAMAGMIRLQWWRDVLAGLRDEEALRHPVAGPLLALARRRKLPGGPFERLLDAREKDLQAVPFADRMSLEGYAGDTAGALTELAAATLGARGDEARAAAQSVGTAWAMLGLLRALPIHLAQGWLTLPEDLLAEAGTLADHVLGGRAERGAIASVVEQMARRADAKLAEARSHPVPRAAIPALLPATLASAHLATLARTGWDVFDARVARPRPMPIRLSVNALLGRF